MNVQFNGLCYNLFTMNNATKNEEILDFGSLRWNLYLSNEIREEDVNNISFEDRILTLASGNGKINGIETDFRYGRVDLHKFLGYTVPEKSKALFAAEIFSPKEQTVIFGAGMDWWWSCFVNGEKVFDRGESQPNGNFHSTFSKVDWVFPVQLKKGKNTIAFYLVSGLCWSVSAAVFTLPEGGKYKEKGKATPEELSGFSLIGETDKDMVGYKVGEEIRFTFRLKDEAALDHGDLYLFWNSVGDDGRSANGYMPISYTNPATVCVSLERPGFLRMVASVMAFNSNGGDTYAKFEGGAGAEVEKIGATSTEPEDFVQYWKEQRRKLSEIPLIPEIDDYLGVVFPDGEKIPSSLKISLVKIPCLGPNPVTGFLARPRKKGKYPIRVIFDGYSKESRLSHRMMTPGVITFHVNAHGYELLRGKHYYEDFIKPFETKFPAYGLSVEENSDPDTAYFHGMACRVMRALEFVKQDKMWNGMDLFVRGGSQGGLQAIWAAHLDKDVTRCECSVNWCSNIAGATLDNRIAGWSPTYVRGLDYYDTVFHAAHIQDKCFVDVQRVGMGDSTCPPSGVTAMYNAVKCGKRIAYYQNSTHLDIPPEPIISRR